MVGVGGAGAFINSASAEMSESARLELVELGETIHRAAAEEPPNLSRGDQGREGMGMKLVSVWSAAKVGDSAGGVEVSWTVGDARGGEEGFLT